MCDIGVAAFFSMSRLAKTPAHTHFICVQLFVLLLCLFVKVLPRRVRCARQCAMPVQHARAPEQARRDTSPDKNKCDKQVSNWRHISCHTDKNRYYT